jgi:hypothetical protein
VSELRQINATVTAFLPADRITRDDYEVVVRGRDAAGKTEDLASYYFRVIAR